MSAITDELQRHHALGERSSGHPSCLAVGVGAALLMLLALDWAARPAEAGAHGVAGAVDSQAALRAPVLGKSVKVSVVRGRVLVKLRGGRRFFRLRHARTIPVRSKLNTTRGMVRLISARNRRGHTQSGRFAGGLFEVRQGRRARGLTELRLLGGDFSRCGPGAGASAERGRRRGVRRINARTRRGRFRTRGRYSASTVRGTIWGVIDRCDGSVNWVRRGSVVVRDLRRDVRVVLQAGDSYLAGAARTPPGPRTLTATKSGNGSGTVTSSPAGIDCGATCSAQYADGTAVTLTATAGPASSFAGWSGCDSTSANSCTVAMSSDRTVTASFAAVARTLTANKIGTGSGTVTSNPAGINCGATCSAQFADGTSVTLIATAAAGSNFGGWSGCDSVSGNQCTISLTANRTVTATFTAAPVQRTLTLEKNGTGTVTSSPAGINCGNTCSAPFADGTLVTLTATPGPGAFTTWGGCDSVDGDQCTVSMTGSRTVTVTFTVLI